MPALPSLLVRAARGAVRCLWRAAGAAACVAVVVRALLGRALRRNSGAVMTLSRVTFCPPCAAAGRWQELVVTPDLVYCPECASTWILRLQVTLCEHCRERVAVIRNRRRGRMCPACWLRSGKK